VRKFRRAACAAAARVPTDHPTPNIVKALVTEAHELFRSLEEGAVATYIPELGNANPEHFGICVMSVDGDYFEAGDCDVEFTIQSISKPFAYAMALTQHGRDTVYKHIGVEPSGDAFNSIVLDERTNRPFNAMVNAGAIAVASLIQGATLASRSEAQLAVFSAAAGRPLRVDERVLQSETETGHRNRAIAWLMRNFNALLPAMLDPRDGAGPGSDGGDACQHGDEPDHRRERVRDGVHPGRALGDADLRNV
jgi:glutaminase